MAYSNPYDHRNFKYSNGNGIWFFLGFLLFPLWLIILINIFTDIYTFLTVLFILLFIIATKKNRAK
jgi:hypothetical protein